MKALTQSITILFFGLVFNSLVAQEPLTAVLNSEDIDRFVKTAIPMTKELDELGIKTDGDANVWSANEEAKSILSKNGWDYQSFGKKFACITWGYTYLTMMDQIEQMPEDQQQAAEQMKNSYLDFFF